MKRRYQVRKSKVSFEIKPQLKWIVRVSSDHVIDAWLYYGRFETVQKAWNAITRLEAKNVDRD